MPPSNGQAEMPERYGFAQKIKDDGVEPVEHVRSSGHQSERRFVSYIEFSTQVTETYIL